MDIGVIGIGGFAAKIIEKIKKNPKLSLCYGFHPDIRKAKQWDEKLGTASLEDIMQSEDIQAVFILTPNHLHVEYAEQALKAKKHIFIEKPLAHTLQDAKRVLEALKEETLKVMVGHNFRRKPCFRKIKEIIDSGSLGKIVNITINHSHGAIFTLPESSWRKKNEFHPEGPLSTVGVHFFDLLHYWFGRVDYLDAVIRNVAGESAAPDTNAVMMSLENGATVFMQTNYCQCSESIVRIYGTNGTIYCDGERLSLRLGRDNNRIPSVPQPIFLPEDNSLEEEIEEFYNSIQSDYQIETGPIEGLNAMMVLDACGVSNLEKRRVYLSEYEEYFISAK